MGIINVTPDSFYDGGKTTHPTSILQQTEKMLSEGATFLDIGGYSSRPGASNISEQEEISRVIPAIKKIIEKFPKAIISIDTFRSSVAKRAIEAGAALINDISAGALDPNMFKTVSQLKVPYIIMHMRGTPQNMNQKTTYSELIKEMVYYFSERISLARKQGITTIVIDPGFGFSKNSTQNFELLNKLELFTALELPILVGISRKSMIYKTLNITAKEALNGSTILHTIALQKNASIIRTHDVKEAMECINLLDKLNYIYKN